MSISDNLKKVQELSSAVAESRAIFKKMAARVDGLKQERAKLRHAVCGKDDFIAFMMAAVDSNAKRAKDEFLRVVEGSMPRMKRFDEISKGGNVGFVEQNPFLVEHGPYLNVQNMCLYFRVQLEVGIKAMADEMEKKGLFKDCKITYERRNARIQEIDLEINDANDQMSLISSSLIKNGVPKSEFHIENIDYE